MVHLFEPDAREAKATLTNHGLNVKALKFSREGASLITSAEDLHIHMIDVATAQRSLTFVSHSDVVTSIDFHPQSLNYFLTSSLDGTIKLWDKNVGKEVKNIDLGGRGVWKAQFTPDGKHIGAVCENGSVAVISFEH